MNSVIANIIINKVLIQNLKHDNDLYKSIRELVAPSYIDSTTLLQREIASSDTLYLAYNYHAELCSFFMVGQHSILLNGISTSTFFLGLSATSSRTKNSGIVRLLYQSFINDVQQLEYQQQHRIPLWHTTATPSTFHAVNLLFIDNEPDMNGNYSETGKQLALAIRKYKNWDYQPLSHPFVLKSIAENTRYSAAERARIEIIFREKNFTLFDKLGIQETNGDRLLRISYAPLLKK